MQVQFVVFHRPGPAWVAGVPFREQPGLQAHVDHYRVQAAAGKSFGGGPFLDETSGGMMVFRVGVSREDVEAVASSDPTVMSGLLLFEVRPWFNAHAAFAS
ncbi:hypothetical protein GHT07_14565 [Caenimonas koreensis DSM 17982]|uniref:YCII-related domain-containing protein n=1 Tax=Caenimonas koreensis DSM 17982 TaxID=1121255 RepID=A0A844BAM1_9BURK|nr:hypothetical protein [Caenimonas koreensis]MRD48507.1 hypothetical protein [Caenimonas koreensis DSM 17982]